MLRSDGLFYSKLEIWHENNTKRELLLKRFGKNWKRAGRMGPKSRISHGKIEVVFDTS